MRSNLATSVYWNTAIKKYQRSVFGDFPFLNTISGFGEYHLKIASEEENIFGGESWDWLLPIYEQKTETTSYAAVL